LEAYNEAETCEDVDTSANGIPYIEEYLREGHPLLTPREKAIISRRYFTNKSSSELTLEKVGKEMGLSKERVRQVQAAALSKLRVALTSPGMAI
jgi:RNA polymerase sigma factor (sigma-70 family)